MKQSDPILAGIAREHLLIPTLESRRADSLDFHDVAVWQVEAALKAAFDEGVRSTDKNVHPQTIELESIDVDQLLAKRRQVAIVWAIEDVQGLRPDLDDDQAWEVLERCRDKHDSEWGFTYSFIEDIADEMFPKPSNPTE